MDRIITDTTLQDQLYKLLPYIYRLRDAEQGEPLRALLNVIGEQVEIVEADIAQMYDNWFIETCADWAVPYIGDLIGYTPVSDAGLPGDGSSAEDQLKNSLLMPRREIANTIAYRRRKGSLALLEQLANDVGGWPARAVEFYNVLAWNQHLAHNHRRGQTVDLRKRVELATLDTPFDTLAHTIDIRNIDSALTQGRFNIANVGLFVWRLRTYSVTKTPVLSLDQRNCYSFSVLGNNTQLFTHWQRETNPVAIAGRQNLPQPISRQDFSIVRDGKIQASDTYYGEGKSLAIWAPDWPVKGAPQPIPVERIVPADLSSWDAYKPVKDTVAVDPVLGRIVFPPRQVPRNGVQVSYYYGLSAELGGGEYPRALTQAIDAVFYRVGPDETYKSIYQALEQWQHGWQKDDDSSSNSSDNGSVNNNVNLRSSAVIEITDSGLYEEPLAIDLPANSHLQIRAANGCRPVIQLADRPDQFQVSGVQNSYLTLDGLLVAGRSIQIEGDISGVIIRHCTLVPGWSLTPDCEPDQLEEPSIDITNAQPCLTIEHSILGSIQINNDEVSRDPINIHISDSVLDATGSDCEGPACEAIGGYGSTLAHACLTILRTTVFGRIDVHAIDLAENTLFMGRIKVARRQRGCMRFCYVSPHSRTPRRYNCQPDLVRQAAEAALIQSADEEHSPAMPDETDIATARVNAEESVRPQFNSRRYGTPTYCQLADSCPAEILRGADDESEMGVFHDLFQPQREANLRARLAEYIPARADVGIIRAN